ncbi:hypothetical protein A3D84_02015 [Candidatus Woesebacteria bacterium RIFCSPHIGHO2_02_FULL_42_20]|uniref:PEGA domain-containing protein n=1 Tax=Candidatus Woesebacteria bacterium RIFCSPHIGHO2_12_FULL_41_24 TaxID=1802510 RepID=A0A1F8ASU8_9BACT|nr:MAG: hypothetical protein A2W15_04300 [Candidatus Woesebacteria bacterium RBG_16_41_13]OGM30022.1 MAG: hypothetical protein A2873_04850 [Candidatus Woesebacteria bacterium RIFCSPHIGHO2_01_FULL_42_80]OGM35100.1 MAG: hypothetical protein A3D84_02015 [Candidatus Woesebacteria bacterium RIFCSPHIGHO2_02_FULL_42_20]OGM54836.1 MAG: hypothetical protein A3E44_01615 [Candidatus Woesebacteria bacterium RIFCSPHIGHO2_12_FULL_41_24]OGM67452.1 MAG: hypothetical protein A2969_05465 [Candidatus Woesebacteri
MTKVRVIVFVLTILIVGTVGTLASLYARGYRFNPKTTAIEPRGILVANSDPNGAAILIDGDLKTATNANIPLPPGTYDVTIKKDGLITWNKRLTIKKEEVTQIEVSLFPQAASLSAITFSGASNPIASTDLTKVAYAVSVDPQNLESGGLWVTDISAFPFGFSREPAQVTDGDASESSWLWSPDGREILLTTKTGAFLLDSGKFTPQAQRVNVSSQKKEILADWQQRETLKTKAKLNKLPDEIRQVFESATQNITFSPDENKILYTAVSENSLPEGIIPPLPGSSTQKQTRDIKIGNKYIFDIKEDRNFEIAKATQPVFWFPTSSHVVIPEPNKVYITDYDGTNRQSVYSGQYVAPHAYPFSNTSKLLILTSLGATDTAPNLYTLNLK